MSPQPAAPVQQSPAHAYAALLIEQAQELEREGAEHAKKVTANRTALRGMDTQGNLNAEQRKFVRTWYPDKEKGSRRSKEEIKATRDLREKARKAKNNGDTPTS